MMKIPFSTFVECIVLSIIFEVLIEVTIPLLMSVIVDCGISGQSLQEKDSFIADILISMGFGDLANQRGNNKPARKKIIPFIY